MKPSYALCLLLVVSIILGGWHWSQAAQAHPSAYCGTGLNVTGIYAVAFVKQHWRDNADGSRSLIRTYKHYQRVGDTSQFTFTHRRNRLCGGIA